MRLNTKFDFPINGVVGVYYDNRRNDFSTNVYATNPSTGYPDAATQIDQREFEDTTKDFALFGEGTWKITDRLALLGGLRYYNDVRDLQSATEIPFFGLGVAGPDAPEHAHNTGSIWKSNLSYRLTDQALVYYAVFGRIPRRRHQCGDRRPGPLRNTTRTPPRTTRSAPRPGWLDNRLTAIVAAYRIDIYNHAGRRAFRSRCN